MIKQPMQDKQPLEINIVRVQEHIGTKGYCKGMASMDSGDQDPQTPRLRSRPVAGFGEECFFCLVDDRVDVVGDVASMEED
jgi:hypothetical protein